MLTTTHHTHVQSQLPPIERHSSAMFTPGQIFKHKTQSVSNGNIKDVFWTCTEDWTFPRVYENAFVHKDFLRTFSRTLKVKISTKMSVSERGRVDDCEQKPLVLSRMMIQRFSRCCSERVFSGVFPRCFPSETASITRLQTLQRRLGIVRCHR